MNVNKLTLKKIFDTTERLEAPLFQRPYVWKRERNWEPLLEAVLTSADSRFSGKIIRPHFLGTIVLDQVPTPTGKISARQIIDGQQRLTTLQIALAAVRDICKKLDIGNYQKAFLKLTDNEIPLSDCADDIFKVWPTNADQNDFREVMLSTSAESVQKMPHSDPDDEWLLPDCYLYFYTKFLEWLNNQNGQELVKRLDALYLTFVEGIQLVVIDLEKDDDPQEIFETLNALGTPLLPADLVKNFLFRTALDGNNERDTLYKRYWQTFDIDRSYWRQDTRQGRLKRPRIDLFLYHYLTLQTGDVIYENQLFSVFKEFFFKKSEFNATQHMQQFKSYADIYRSFENQPHNSREELFFYRLGQMDTTIVYPLLLEVFHSRQSPELKEDLVQIISDLESFLVRRMVCELTSKNYNKFFTDLIHAAHDAHDFSSTMIRNYLTKQTAETSRWPDDNEFKTAWLELPFYSRLKRSKTRLILEAIERQLYTEKTEKIEIQRSLTIEHLLPQGWEEHWPLNYDENVPGAKELAEVGMRRALHKIGNLTLLTKHLNPAVSNAAWVEKRHGILNDSALRLNSYFLDKETWREDMIDKRSIELFDSALKIWPRPH